MTRHVLAASLLPLVLVSAAACETSNDGRGVASVSGSAAPQATATFSIQQQGLRHARCMREHGVPEADPQVNGNGSLRVGGGYDKHTLPGDVLARAIEACKPYEVVMPPDVTAKKLEGAREYARCMRAHGVQNFPDPDANLRFQIPDQLPDNYEQVKAICAAPTPSSSQHPTA
jgi:hypothetical protein